MRFKKADAKTLGEPQQFCQYDETARGLSSMAEPR